MKHDNLRTHETRRVSSVGPDLLVDLDQALLDNRGDLPASQGIFQPVTEENSEGETFPQLVWTRGWTRSLT